MDQKQNELKQCERELSTAGPPKFISVEEARNSGSLEHNVIVLKDKDLARVRRAESSNGSAIEEMEKLKRDIDSLIPIVDSIKKEKIEAERDATEAQKILKEKSLLLKSTQDEHQQLALCIDESRERNELFREYKESLNALIDQCRSEELEYINDCVDAAYADLQRLTEEANDRKEKNEVELASLKIAYKELQGESEVLKDNIKFLTQHQKDLERLAKQQQVEEKNKNSLKKLMWNTLTLSSGTESESKQLKPQYEAELVNDHLLVSTLAATIYHLEKDRNSIANNINKVQNAYNNDELNNCMEKIEDILDSNIVLDEAAINDS